jgi:putative redox protein
MATNIKAFINKNHYKTTLTNGRNKLIADEPTGVGGTDLGFSPSELLCSALAACTCATLRMYADRKGWALEDVQVSIDFERNNEQNTSQIKRHITLVGDLSADEKARLMGIANKCPIHKVLTNPIEILTALED